MSQVNDEHCAGWAPVARSLCRFVEHFNHCLKIHPGERLIWVLRQPCVVVPVNVDATFEICGLLREPELFQLTTPAIPEYTGWLRHTADLQLIPDVPGLVYRHNGAFFNVGTNLYVSRDRHVAFCGQV